MKSCKVMATLVTLGLAAAVATPALALENQFNGAFTSFYDLSNYSATGNGASGGSNFTGLENDAKTQNYFVQRVRLGYTAKASDDVKLVTKFEFDYNYWGNSSYAVGRGSGGALGADSVNMETKNLYLDLNYPKFVNAKIGMQSYYDSFKGIIFDADMAGILLAHEYDNASVTAGFFRFDDSNSTTIGKNTRDMFALDGKYNVSKQLKVGAAYYYIADNRSNSSTTTASADPSGQTADGTFIYPYGTTFTTTTAPDNDAEIHTLGLNAETTIGPVTLTGFALTQFGDLNATTKAKGYALNLGAKMPLAGGTARSEFLYVPGGNNALYVVADEGGAFYDSEMIILNRDKNATTIDNAIVFDVNNANQGVIMGSLGYDYTFTSKLSGSVNAGFAAVSDSTGPNNSDYLGTEINCEANYKIMPTVTLGARAGYMVLGDYFENIDAGKTPDNPYDVKLLAKFVF